MAVLPPPGPPRRDLASDQYDRGREMLGVDPGLDSVDLVQLDEQTMELNMGPQHPSTHGVLRLVLDLDGEVVKGCHPDIGFLHTGFEKDFERHNYWQCIPYTDRMDYLSPLSNNLGFSLAVERLLEVEVPPRAQYLRVIMCELARVASHLIWYGTTALDLGATTPFVYAWREREKILDINELVSGVRMHTSFIRAGGLLADVPDEFYGMVEEVVRTFPAFIDEYEVLITGNEIFRERTRGVGVISAADAVNYGVTGPSLRGSGVPYDLRKAKPYSSYDHFHFDIPIGEHGDIYDRYLVRMQEMRESLKIIDQAMAGLPGGPVNTADRKVALPPRNEINTSMEFADPAFQAGDRGVPGAPRDGLRGDRIAARGDRLPAGERRNQPAIPLQGPGPLLQQPQCPAPHGQGRAAPRPGGGDRIHRHSPRGRRPVSRHRGAMR